MCNLSELTLNREFDFFRVSGGIFSATIVQLISIYFRFVLKLCKIASRNIYNFEFIVDIFSALSAEF